MAYDHYIPQFILRNWSDNQTHIWTYSRKYGVQRKRIDKVFGVRNLYAKMSIDSTNSASTSADPRKFRQSIRSDPYPYDRDMIGPLESAAAPIIKCIIVRVKRGHRPLESRSDAEILQRFLFLTVRRTPESQQRVFEDRTKQADDLSLAILNDRLKESQYDYSFRSLEDLHEQFPHTKIVRDVVRSNTLAQFSAGATPKLRAEIKRFCEETGFLILSAKDAPGQFIVGSCGHAPVVRKLESGKYGRSSVFPLSPEIAIVVTSDREKYGVGDILPRLLCQTNIAMAEHSHTIVASTKDELLKFGRYM